MRIVTILGARPQFIKATLVSKEIQSNGAFREVIIHTGQHFDQNMSDIFFKELSIPKPDYQLNINQMGHGEMTGRMLIEIEKILQLEKPQGIIVYGDTNSTLAGSLAAAKLQIPVFHIEAGLRSFNRSMPEEINRVLTDQISRLLFCPTQHAIDMLKKEGISDGVIFSGDIMYDLFQASQPNTIHDKRGSVLATIHRPANTDDSSVLESIIRGLETINRETPVIFPVHPRTEKKIEEFGIKSELNMIPPLSYQEMVNHLSNAKMVITDSGGVQKEAYFSKTKCITVRPETEWVELVDAGVNILCESNKDAIDAAYHIMVQKSCDFSQTLYGHGNASKMIVDSMVDYLSSGNN
ncbi:MAG: UDP-N-acetylglucosamine 2-epimerase (non-hydrolyzing) [Candidatus Marinimicrobia bacterium]|nr:UDP-N-acetylglucosamine 2-epimerase (non-hydrolyzing) [Candidatus Neomarinimicrobiota bacterium]